MTIAEAEKRIKEIILSLKVTYGEFVPMGSGVAPESQGVANKEANRQFHNRLPDIAPVLSPSQHGNPASSRQARNVCPVCGSKLIYEEGCKHCSSCDWSACG